MIRSESLTELAPALIKARGLFAPIKRTKDVTIAGERRSYSFKYAPLDEIQAATDPALRECGLCVIQNVGDSSISTMILHTSGEFLETDAIPLNGNLYGTQFGAEVTYKRRYQLAGALNVAIEDDADAPEVNALNQPDGKVRVTQKITPTAGVLQSLPSAEQESIRMRAQTITEAFAMRNPMLAFEAYENCGLKGEELIALWSLLDSKARSTIKKMQTAKKENPNA